MLGICIVFHEFIFLCNNLICMSIIYCLVTGTPTGFVFYFFASDFQPIDVSMDFIDEM